MAFNHFLNRRNVAVFSVFALGGSYLLLKSRTLQSKAEQLRREGDYKVDPSRSGGGI